MPAKVAQGDLSLLETDLAKKLLTSTIPARLAYVWIDGTPLVIPTYFHWSGEEVVVGSTPNAPKFKALRANPAVALTIDSPDYPPEVLMIRGTAELSEHDGIIPEYAAYCRRYLGEEGGSQWLAQMEQIPGMRMTRLAIRPEWVGILDFVTRFPSAISE